MNRPWHSFSFGTLTTPPPTILSQDCNIFHMQCKTCICCFFCCYLNGWVSTRCTQPSPHYKKNTQDRNIKCPQSVCKRMPSITLYAGLKWWTTTSQHVTGARTLWKMIWEMHNIFSLPSAWLSQTFKLQAMCPIAMLIQCILNKCNFKVFFYIHDFSSCPLHQFLWWYYQGEEDIQLQWIPVLDISVNKMWIEMYVNHCGSDNAVK